MRKSDAARTALAERFHAAIIPAHLQRKFGPMSARERLIYSTAYQAGYARAKYRASVRTVAA